MQTLNENRKNLGWLIILFGVIMICIIIYFLFFFNKPKEVQEIIEEVTQENVVNLPKTTNQSIEVQDEPRKAVTTKELNRDDLAKMASSFAERFGSYSNHSNFGNVRDLKIFMSRKMQNWADKFINDQVKSGYTDIYYGVTTKSISTDVKKYDESSSASILVSTQRRESTGSTNNTSTYYQDILVSFIKENGSWKVDAATWQNK
jgi:LPS O-antigen subunit length determinant protein (WzzB/FepE family)